MFLVRHETTLFMPAFGFYTFQIFVLALLCSHFNVSFFVVFFCKIGLQNTNFLAHRRQQCPPYDGSCSALRQLFLFIRIRLCLYLTINNAHTYFTFYISCNQEHSCTIIVRK